MDEIRQILDWLHAEPSAARVVAAASKLTRLGDMGLPEIRIAILRNVTLEPIRPYIQVKCFEAGLKPVLMFGGFNTAPQEARDPASELYKFKPDIVVLALRLNALAPEMGERFTLLAPEAVEQLAAAAVEELLGMIRIVRAQSAAPILVHNFELPLYPAGGIPGGQSPAGPLNLIRDLNRRLLAAVAPVGQTIVVDIEHLLGQVGYESGLDDRNWHQARAPYALPLLDKLAAEYVRIARALKGKARKCLVLDCDNTLWGGIVGEDGLQGIQLGRTYPGSAYRAFQSAVLELQHRGILLALCSKNNEADVLEVLDNHPECLIRKEHLACTRINWNDKAANLREIARELNIGLDSLVFVDDSEFECSLIRQTVPEVQVLHLPKDPTRYERILRGLDSFDALAVTAEDLARTRQYQIEAQRQGLRAQSGSIEDYLRSLDMVLTLAHADPLGIPRIAQLTQKTNQFNLTGRRYSEAEIYSLAKNADAAVYSAHLEDRFDSSGIIAVAIVRYEGDGAAVDTFLMSCRVIGRGVEGALLAHLAAEARQRGCRRMTGEYRATKKNAMTADFYPRHGFQPTGAGTYELLLEGPGPAAPAWFKTIRHNPRGPIL